MQYIYILPSTKLWFDNSSILFKKATDFVFYLGPSPLNAVFMIKIT